MKGPFTIVKDTEKERGEIKFTNELARETAYDPRAVEVVTVEQPAPIFSHICFVPLFDVHGAAVGSNAIREEKAVDFVKNTSNAFCVIGGDAVNSIIKADQNSHDDKFGNQRAIARAIDLYAQILDKMPLILDGNHDGENGNRFSASNMSPIRHIVDGLRSYDRETHSWVGPQHCKFGAILKFQVPTCDNRRDLKTISIYLHHGSGKGGTPASSIDNEYAKAVAYINEQGELVDAVVTGHHHSNTSGIVPQRVPVYNEEGKLVNVLKKNAVVVSESTLQEVSNYALAGGFNPADSNVYIYDLCMVRNPFFTTKTQDTEPEYIMQYTRIPMFRKNSNEYTDEAKEYMEIYMEPSVEKITASIKRTNSEKLNTRLARQVDNYNTVKFIEPYLREGTNTVVNEEPQVVMPDDREL